MGTERDLDVVVFGATGFVGRLTADAPGRARAAARADRRWPGARTSGSGRARRTAGAGRATGRCSSPTPTDAASLGGWSRPTQVVATTVGPYLRYGLPLVEACARPARTTPTSPARCCSCATASTASTTPPPRPARASCTPAASTRSRPTSASLLAAEQAQADGAGELDDTTLLVVSMKGGVSGGTSTRPRADRADSDDRPRRALVDGRPVRPQPGPAGRARPRQRERRPRRRRRRARRAGRPVRHGAVQHAHRPAQQRAAGPGRTAGASATARSWPRPQRRSRPVARHRHGSRARCVHGAGMGFRRPARCSTGCCPRPGDGPGEKTRERGHFRVDVHARTSTTGARYGSTVRPEGRPRATPPPPSCTARARWASRSTSCPEAAAS